MTKTKTIKTYRQGDVLLIETKATLGAPSPVDPDGSVTLAHGEVTGHRHRFAEPEGITLSSDLAAEGRAARMLVELGAGGLLTHEEHAPIAIPKGTFEVRIKCEYDPAVHGGARQVVD